jgi:DNA-binding winged helix-turn-helix (wHTH) protein
MRGRGGVTGLARHRSALVEVGASSPDYRHALAKALKELSLLRAESLYAALGLAGRVVLLVGESVDPVAPIRSCASDRHSHILVACERAEGSEVARWARAGVTNCFVGAESLIELRSALLAYAGEDAPNVVLDANDLVVEVAGVRARLTRTQFRLLQHLILNATSGRWITAPELVKEALGTHHENDSALVRVHIHAIRRALGPLASLIETDPGRARGYRFRNDLAQSAFAATSFGEPSRL